MKGIIFHWTGGTHNASALDKKHYHSIFTGSGARVIGNHTIADNDSTSDGIYAAHTWHMNTHFIGLSIACMGGKDVKERPINYGKWPPTKIQVSAMCKHAAALCHIYGIKVTRKTVMCHSEVQKNMGIKQRGKWDINHLPWLKKSGNTYIGDYLRDAVSRELMQLGEPDDIADMPTAEINIPKKTTAALGLAGLVWYYWDKITDWIF